MNSSHERKVLRRLNGSAMADADSKIIAMKSFAVTEMRVMPPNENKMNHAAERATWG